MNNIRVFSRNLVSVAVLAALSGAAGAALPDSHLDLNDTVQQAFASQDGAALPVLPAKDARVPFLLRFAAPATTDPAAPVARDAKGKPRLKAQQTRDHVARIKAQQDAGLSKAGAMLGRALQAIDPRFRFVHTGNGVVVRISSDEARALGKLSDVAGIEPLRFEQVASDQGPALIGAAEVWGSGGSQIVFGPSGFPMTVTNSRRGEGVVVGVLDTGLNFDSPSFQEVDMDGYRHINPLGEGNYLGLCNDAGDSQWTPRCNSKVIGAHDLIAPIWADVLEIYPNAADGPGPEDEGGHGSHTASTAAGNRVSYQVPAGPLVELSGVAPRANIVVYNVCFSPQGTGGGSCPNFSTLAAAEQAVEDGIVDVLNYSISGGTDPWGEPTSRAFLGAADAGIFIAAAAGNDGPGLGTTMHAEPWVTTVAATTHTRAAFVNPVQVSAPAPLAPELADLTLFTVPSNFLLPSTLDVPLGFDDANPQGCTTPASGSTPYAGQAMLVYRGGPSACSFATKVRNMATRGGAAAVIIANNEPGDFNPSIGTVSVPVAKSTQAQGDLLAAAIADGSATRMQFVAPRVALANTPDIVAPFSGRGPNGIGNLKPDLSAPGVAILAAYANSATEFGADAYRLLNGTSMATPHVAGAAALLRQLHPDWTPSQIKSALMMTATQEVFGDDGVTPANQYEMGAGRIQVDAAARAGLIMDETSLHYAQAAPEQGGDTATLNLPSLKASSCVSSCSFTRTVTSSSDQVEQWSVAISSLNASATPSEFSIAPGASQQIAISIDVEGAATDTRDFGELTLTPANPELQTLHWPLSTYIDPPDFTLRVPASGLSAVLRAGQTREFKLKIGNPGNAGMQWSLANGPTVVPVLNQPPDFTYVSVSTLYGDTSNLDVDRYGIFTADDITLDEPTRVRTLTAYGVNQGSAVGGTYAGPLSDIARTVTWRIFADDGGRPAGYPSEASFREPIEVAPPEPEAALWSYTAAPGSAGVSNEATDLTLDLDAAGQTLELPPGTYWVVAFIRQNTTNGVFRQFLRSERSGNAAMVNFNHPFIAGVNDVIPFTWLPIRDYVPDSTDAAWRLDADRVCGASWARASIDGHMHGAGESVDLTITFDTDGVAPNTSGTPAYSGLLCVQTNVPSDPFALLPMTLRVLP